MKRYVAVRGERVSPLAWRGNCATGSVIHEERETAVDGRWIDGELSVRLGDRIYRVERLGGGRCRVNGREFSVNLRSELQHRFAEFGAGDEDGPGLRLEVPMPGRVVKVLVKPGEEVQKGQGLVIVEAMKMENELKAQSSGVVKTLHVDVGQSVEKGTLLLELE